MCSVNSLPLDGRGYCSGAADDGNGGNKNDKHNHEDVLRRLIMGDLRLLFSVLEVFSRLGYYAAWFANWLPFFLDCLTIEDGTDRLFRNVGTKLPN